MPKYRYIASGICNPEDKISNFRLVGSFKEFRPTCVIRIEIPDSIVLDRYPYDGYSTTESNIQIKDLNPIVIVRCNSRMMPNLELTDFWLAGNIAPHEFSRWMQQHGYMCYLRFGYITAEQHDWIFNLKNYHEKIWQVDKIPARNESFDFIPMSEYKTHYGEYFDEIHKAIDNDEDVKLLVKELNLSDEELFEEYAYHCFCSNCDTKLHHMNFEWHHDKAFTTDLKDQLMMKKLLQNL